MSALHNHEDVLWILHWGISNALIRLGQERKCWCELSGLFWGKIKVFLNWMRHFVNRWLTHIVIGVIIKSYCFTYWACDVFFPYVNLRETERDKNDLITQLIWWAAMGTWGTAGRWWVSLFCGNLQHRSALKLWIMGNIGYTLVHREEICRDWWGIYPSVTPSFFQYKQIYSVTVRKGIPYHCFTEARRGSSEQRIPLLKCGCCCCCTQSLMFETRQICRVVSEVQQLHCDEYMAQRQCVHEGALDMCTLKIHSMWFSPFLC